MFMCPALINFFSERRKTGRDGRCEEVGNEDGGGLDQRREGVIVDFRPFFQLVVGFSQKGDSGIWGDGDAWGDGQDGRVGEWEVCRGD